MNIPQVIARSNASSGEMGQEYLATGNQVALRYWQESPTETPEGDPGGFGEITSRDYEIVGYLFEGRFELEVEGKLATIDAGDSWLVPAGAAHRYRIVKPIVAIEATSPPARFNHRDE